MLNEDYRDMLQSLVAEKAEFLLIGAYAMAAHGHPRATMDIDIWVMPSHDNAQAVLRALRRFGAPLHDLRDNASARGVGQKREFVQAIPIRRPIKADQDRSLDLWNGALRDPAN